MTQTDGTGALAVVPPTMTKEEAMEHVAAINSAASDMGRHLLIMKEREGWRALGYRSWTAFLAGEFEFSRNHLYELMRAAPVLEKLSSKDYKIGMKAAVALSQFDEDLQPAIVKTVQSRYRRITPSNVERVGNVVQLMAHTGTVDIGNGENTPIDAALDKEDEEAAKRQKTYIHDNPTTTKPHVTHNSGENEWYTPPVYIDAARRVMGAIDLDPASSDKAQEIVNADAYYTQEQDGLRLAWYGRVWMNPPYGRGLIDKFVDRLVEHVEGGDVEQACVIVNNATETAWFQRLLDVGSAVCLVSGRVTFLNTDLQPAEKPLQGQAIVYVGPKKWRFEQVFSEFGKVLHV